MIGPDQITVPVRIGTVVRDFGPVRSPNLIGPKLIGPVRGLAIWSVFFPIVIFSDRTDSVIGTVRIFKKIM